MIDRRQMLKLMSGTTATVLAGGLPVIARAADRKPMTAPPAHDPVIAREGDTYYLFTTHGLIHRWSSPDLVHWTKLPDLLPEMPAWVRAELPQCKGLWAPDISFHNGRWQVYYSASTFGSTRSAIGLATAPSLAPGTAWTDHGKVLETRDKDTWNAIDANFILDDTTGDAWLSAGSFWSGLKLVRLDSKTGLRPANDNNVISIAKRPGDGSIEAPFIVRHGEWFYLFASFDFCCRGANSTYNIRVGRSKTITGPYVDKANVAMMEGGGSIVLEGYDNVRGPGHCQVFRDDQRDLLVHHYYDANRNGHASVQVRPLTWDDAGWPVAGAPIGAGGKAGT